MDRPADWVGSGHVRLSWVGSGLEIWTRVQLCAKVVYLMISFVQFR